MLPLSRRGFMSSSAACGVPRARAGGVRKKELAPTRGRSWGQRGEDASTEVTVTDLHGDRETEF
jgi:hypothetical protein